MSEAETSTEWGNVIFYAVKHEFILLQLCICYSLFLDRLSSVQDTIKICLYFLLVKKNVQHLYCDYCVLDTLLIAPHALTQSSQ